MLGANRYSLFRHRRRHAETMEIPRTPLPPNGSISICPWGTRKTPALSSPSCCAFHPSLRIANAFTWKYPFSSPLLLLSAGGYGEAAFPAFWGPIHPSSGVQSVRMPGYSNPEDTGMRRLMRDSSLTGEQTPPPTNEHRGNVSSAWDFSVFCAFGDTECHRRLIINVLLVNCLDFRLDRWEWGMIAEKTMS